MPDKTTTTDVILAAGPTVVALAAIGSAVWQKKREFRHQRALEDRADARKVLDDAAVALHDAEYARYAVLGVGPGAADDKVKVKVREAGVAMDVLRGRLALRLGPDHEAVREFAAATDALLAIQREIGKPRPPADAVDEWHAVQAAGKAFEDAQGRFLAAAVKAAGARLT